ncbi:MAG: hypothetical protein QXW78_00175 [Candidatus Thermoplasmatota archaeon]
MKAMKNVSKITLVFLSISILLLPSTFQKISPDIELHIRAGVNRPAYREDDYGFGYGVDVYNRRNEPVTAFYYATYYTISGKRNDSETFVVPPGLGSGRDRFCFSAILSPIKVHLEAGGKEKTREGFVVFGFVVFLTNEEK